MLQEEERRLKEELDKRRADLGAAPYEGGGAVSVELRAMACR